MILELAEQLDTPDVAADSLVEDISSDVERPEVVLVPAPSVNSRPLVILDYHNTLEHFGVIPTPVVEAVRRLEDTGVAIRCRSYVGTAFREQTTRDAWVAGPLSHIPLEFVYRKSWRSARRRDGRSDKKKHRGSWSLEQLHCATTPGTSWTNCKSGGTDFWIRGKPRGRYR